MIFCLKGWEIVKFPDKESAIEFLKIHGGVAMDTESSWMYWSFASQEEEEKEIKRYDEN